MSQTHLSMAPMDPYQWRESVLSTRSLSYLSTTDALPSPGFFTTSRNPSSTRRGTRSRRGTSNSGDDSDDDLVMGGTDSRDNMVEERELDDIPELPDSVAESALFTLPREIRDRVYAFCLTAHNGLPVEWPPLPGASPLYGLQPQIIRTCRIIHDEAAPLLYSLNTMTFHHPSDANMFVRAIAAPGLARRYITNLGLHIKATDTRLWMPYLTSADVYRSLKADFTGLRDLGVRYRSNKWNHSHTPEQNLKDWSEDNRLDEIIDGLRHVFPPPPPPAAPGSRSDDQDGVKPLNEMTADEFMRFIDARKPGEDMAYKRHLLELHKAHAPAAKRPIIRVVCACRVHSAHFNLITGWMAEGTQRLPDSAALLPPPPQNDANGRPQPEPTPVIEGEAFRGFSAADFRSTDIKRLYDPDLGSAKVVRSSFTDKKGVLIALEVHTLDPKRDGMGERHRA